MSRDVTSNILKLYVIKISKWLMITVPIVFLFYRENGLGTRDLFLLKAVYSFAIVVMEIPSGYFGDVWGRKTSLVIGSVLGAVGFGLYCVSTGFWGFLVCEVVLGVGQSFISGSDSALLYDTLQEGGQGEAYLKEEGRLVSIGNYAEAVAAPIGVALAALSLRTPFYFQALVAFSAVPASLLLFEPKRRKITSKGNVTQVFQIIRYALTRNTGLKWSIIYSSVIGTATLTMAWLIQPYFVFLAVPLALYGLFLPALNLTTGSVSMHAWKVEKSLGRDRTVLFIAVAIASIYLALSFFSTLWAVGLLFLFYTVRGVATPVLRNYINASTPSEIRATVLSIRSLIIRLAFVVIGPFLGWYADRSGMPATLFAGGLVFLVAGVWSGLQLVKETTGHSVQPFLAEENT
ncbi:MFS transporter [Desulfoluna limicola]|uniref:MFS transporter n=1 Tax=Desulfoluna limicola TaxID=2810562 RepID=A0ABM7PHD2_9BACT|nr:MFS transporter [Desulfoluna limicola]BCS96608.1 MFS transporter [Desulfoluna limicola]